MRRGYFDSSGQALRPVQIEYESDSEDLIAEIISRLDELGDTVDGSIGDEELDRLLKSFERWLR